MKVLGDYTIREIKQYCDTVGSCSDCQLLQGDRCIFAKVASCWNTDIPLCALISKDDILAARILRNYANVEKIIRNPDGLFARTKDGLHIELCWESFLSIEVGNVLEVGGL